MLDGLRTARKTIVFVIAYFVFALLDLFVFHPEKYSLSYTDVIQSDMGVLVLLSLGVTALVEWLIRKRWDKGEQN
jgi:hypothetical protein